MTEQEKNRIDNVLRAYGWYFRNYMTAKANGNTLAIKIWERRMEDFQIGVQKADPFGRWPMRFAWMCRQIQEEITGGQEDDRTLTAGILTMPKTRELKHWQQEAAAGPLKELTI